MADYSEAIDYFVDESRVFIGQNSHSAIVLHGTGGSADQSVEQLGDWFRSDPNMASVHFGVGRDGRIAQYVSLADGAAGNCCLEAGHDPYWDQFGGDNLNIHTISIEHVNDASNSLPLTPAQQDASFKLVAWLCSTYNLTFDQVKTHASIDPASRARCPGPAYPLDALKAYLQGGTNMNGTTYEPGKGDFDAWFTVGPDGNWTCKRTGAVLMGANKALYSQLSIDGNTLPVIGLPLSSEQYQIDSDGYHWSKQPCERAEIWYDPRHKHDGQPGFTDSYLAHTQVRTVEKIPDAVLADIKKLASDAGV